MNTRIRHAMAHFSGWLAFLVVTGFPVSMLAAEPRPGEVYDGGSRVQVDELGLEFTIPPEWVGGLEPSGEFFLMESPGRAATIFVIADALTAEQALDVLRGPIELTDSLQLILRGEIEKEASEFAARYDVSFNPGLAVEARAESGSNGVSIGFFLISQSDQTASFLPSLEAAFSSLEMKAVETASAGDDPMTANSTDGGDSWAAYLKGKHIVRFFTGSGYTEEQHIWLCSNGSYIRRFGSGGFGGGASGAVQGNFDGIWTATGVGDSGKLILDSNAGQAVFELYWDYDENRLYVDGKRWLHDENTVCN